MFEEFFALSIGLVLLYLYSQESDMQFKIVFLFAGLGMVLIAGLITNNDVLLTISKGFAFIVLLIGLVFGYRLLQTFYKNR